MKTEIKNKYKTWKIWKKQFDKDYGLLKEKLLKKVDEMAIREFDKFKKQQIKLAKEAGLL